MATYELLKQEGSAKRAVFHTVHGDIQTPVFMNVGTVAAIKGAVSTMDLKEIKCQDDIAKSQLRFRLRKYRRQRKTDGQRILNCHPTGTAIISLQRQPLQ